MLIFKLINFFNKYKLINKFYKNKWSKYYIYI